MAFSIAVFRVKGRGCASCIEPVKIHLFKHPGVRGVHIRGYRVIVFYDPRYSVDDILRETGVLEYYVMVREDGGMKPIVESYRRSFHLHG